MKLHMPFIAVALATSPAIAQPTPNSSMTATAGTVTPKSCEPEAPEKERDGELVYTACQIKSAGGSVPKMLSSPKRPDLSALYRRGIQGEVFFELIIGQDGHMRNMSIRTSSRSPELDAIAAALLTGSTFSPAVDRDGKPVNLRATLPMYFWKDSLTDPKFFKKSCQDFLTDAAWRAEHFPEEKPDEYRGWLLAKGAMVMGSIRAAGGLSAIGQNREFPRTPVYSDVVAACKANPAKPFFDVLTNK